jgi:glycosyltransferase involved in cell wall biosynthesis
VDEVLQIFKNVEKKVKSKLIIIGEGPDMEKVNQFLEENPDLISKIRLLGKVNDLYKIFSFRMYFSSFGTGKFWFGSIGSNGSLYSGYQLKCRRIPEVNIQGETGYLAEIGNVEAMSNYTIKLLSNDELLVKMKKMRKNRL